jgi:hypothetical protein
LVVCVRGEKALERFTRAFQNKTINQHPISVRALDGTNGLAECHILFLGTKDNTSELLQAAGASGILTFGEAEQFLTEGGMVRFHLEEEHLHLEINDRQVRRCGLLISSRAVSTLVKAGTARLNDF